MRATVCIAYARTGAAPARHAFVMSARFSAASGATPRSTDTAAIGALLRSLTLPHPMRLRGVLTQRNTLRTPPLPNERLI